MAPQDHELMILMFARMFQAMGAIRETLKSRGLWTADDEKAFDFQQWDDNSQILKAVHSALTEYRKCADQSGVRIDGVFSQGKSDNPLPE